MAKIRLNGQAHRKVVLAHIIAIVVCLQSPASAQQSPPGGDQSLITLNGEIELDKGFFETVSITRDKSEPLKRGRGSQRQTTVLVTIESKPVEEHLIQKKYSTKSSRKIGINSLSVLSHHPRIKCGAGYAYRSVHGGSLIYAIVVDISDVVFSYL